MRYDCEEHAWQEDDPWHSRYEKARQILGIVRETL